MQSLFFAFGGAQITSVSYFGKVVFKMEVLKYIKEFSFIHIIMMVCNAILRRKLNLFSLRNC